MSDMKPFDLLLSGDMTEEEFCQLSNTLNEDAIYNDLGLTTEEYDLFIKLGTEALDDIKKARAQKKDIIEKGKMFFKDEIADSHIRNTEKLKNLKEFNLNPFLEKYKATFLTGNSSPESIAKALVYPRVLGQSINTSFGMKLQKFCSTVLNGYASTTTGIDIEFVDLVDGRHKYCQIKAGPNTINKDDVKTIEDHFSAVKNLARTNNLNIGINDLVVGVFYGEPNELSSHYKKIQTNHPVYIGKEFWYRLTGDESFYNVFTNAIGEVASEFDNSQLINDVIEELSKEIEKITED